MPSFSYGSKDQASLELEVNLNTETQEDRIAQILADGDVDNEELQEKSLETIAKYLRYLKENLAILTGDHLTIAFTRRQEVRRR